MWRIYSWTRLQLVKRTSTLLMLLNIQSLIRYSGLNRQYEVFIKPSLDVLPLPICENFICFFWVCLQVPSWTSDKKIFMYITSVQLENCSTVGDIINCKFWLSLLLHRAFCRNTLSTNKCTYIKFRIKTFKIAPTCFDPKIILRELRCSLLKSF